MPLYRDFATTDELNAEYLLDPGASLPAIQQRAADSVDARSRLAGHYDIRFGPTVDEYLDIFPCGTPGAPVHMFIHGGYWWQLSAKLFSFVAERMVENGITVVVNNYSLCPHVTIDEIVRQCRAAVKWIADNAGSYDGNPENITVSGHSAGGHLAAMLACTDWEAGYGLSPEMLRGIIGISGLYDLRPFPFTALQPNLQLTWDQVYRNSPLMLDSFGAPPVRLFVGAEESSEFRRQSEDYAAALKDQGRDVSCNMVDGKDHLNVIDGFTSTESSIFRAVTELVGAA